MKTRASKIAAWSALAAILFVTVSPISMRPSDFLPVNVDRALAFSVLSGLVAFAYPRYWKWAILAAVVGPGALELLQEFSPTRHAHLEDAVYKTAGALIGIPFGIAANEFIKAISSYRRRAARKLVFQQFGAGRVQHVAVKSRMIESIYFSPENGQLYIGLSNGLERLFEGVTETEVRAISEAPSPGNYYLDEFKARHKRAA